MATGQFLLSAIAIIISLVTLLTVVKTLNQQNDVNRAQFEMLRIESNRAAREVRPLIEFKTRGADTSKFESSIVNHFYFQCSHNKAIGVSIEFLKISHGIAFSENMMPGSSFGTMLPGDVIDLEMELTPSLEDGVRETIIRIHYRNIDDKAEYEDFAIRQSNIFAYQYDKITEYTNVNKFADWLMKKGSEVPIWQIGQKPRLPNRYTKESLYFSE